MNMYRSRSARVFAASAPPGASSPTGTLSPGSDALPETGDGTTPPPKGKKITDVA